MDHARRLSLLVTSPRVAPGLLSHQAWRALHQAHAVFARTDDEALAEAVIDAGVSIQTPDSGAEDPSTLARMLVEAAQVGPVVWLGSPDADPGLSDAIAHEITRLEDAPELELLIGSWDVPGSRLLDAVAVMDQLRSPGGCPWDAEQTHVSLTPYLIEEAYECVEALESGEREHIVEELGDVLLQVLFNARVGAEEDFGVSGAAGAFDIDDVAGGLVDKLIRRHPHVFAGGDAGTPGEVEASWRQLKAAEKPERTHLLDGIPAGMPELARAVKITSRLARAGHQEWLDAAIADLARAGEQGEYASRLLDIVVEAQSRTVDPCAALRAGLIALATQHREHDAETQERRA